MACTDFDLTVRYSANVGVDNVHYVVVFDWGGSIRYGAMVIVKTALFVTGCQILVGKTVMGRCYV